jgi:copper chaperone NosL
VRGTVAVVLALAGCAGGAARPAEVDTRNDACAQCRMIVSDARYAGQVVGGGAEPRFFDDLGCLASYLRQNPPAGGAAVFVADRRTKQWVPAAGAVYTRVPGLDTPMGSGIVAHADAASRDADRDVAGGKQVTAAELFGPAVAPRGTR